MEGGGEPQGLERMGRLQHLAMVVVVAGGAVDTGGGLATAESTAAQRNVDPAYSNNKNRHSPYLPSEQGTTAAPYQPPLLQIHGHNPKSPKSNANPPRHP